MTSYRTELADRLERCRPPSSTPEKASWAIGLTPPEWIEIIAALRHDGPGVPLVAIVAARRALFAQHAPPGYADDCETCQHLQELDEYIKGIPATGTPQGD